MSISHLIWRAIEHRTLMCCWSVLISHVCRDFSSYHGDISRSLDLRGDISVTHDDISSSRPNMCPRELMSRGSVLITHSSRSHVLSSGWRPHPCDPECR